MPDRNRCRQTFKHVFNGAISVGEWCFDRVLSLLCISKKALLFLILTWKAVKMTSCTERRICHLRGSPSPRTVLKLTLCQFKFQFRLLLLFCVVFVSVLLFLVWKCWLSFGRKWWGGKCCGGVAFCCWPRVFVLRPKLEEIRLQMKLDCHFIWF